MKIVIATPLYPPDIDETALYVKELAKRLGGEHEVNIVTYGKIPEKVEGVNIVSVRKKHPLPIRLLLYTFALWKVARRTEIIYAQNGPSVELPAGVISLITKKPFIMHMIDKNSHERASKNWIFRKIENFVFKRAKKIVSDTPLPRPEILPFQAMSEEEILKYEESWIKHINELNEIFKNEK